MSSILIDEQAPRWLRELGRFLPLKSLLFLDGNVNDFLSYPIRRDSGEIYWTETLLRQFFERLFDGLGYDVVGFVDPLEELQFLTPKMAEQFQASVGGSNCPPPTSPGAPAPTSPGAPAPGGSLDDPFLPPSAPRAVKPAPVAASGGVPRRPDWNRTIDQIGMAMRSEKGSCAFVLQYASRLTSNPEILDDAQRTFFTKMLRLSLEAPLARSGAANNILVLICDKLNDLPPFLYLNNPRSRSIHLDLPDRQDRARFLRQHWPGFHGFQPQMAEPPPEARNEFVDLTDGLTQYELLSLERLSQREQIPICDPMTGGPNVRSIIEKFKYGVTESGWDRVDEKIQAASEYLRATIHGQAEAVERVLDVMARARFGLAAGEGHRSNRPRGVLFFAGPTGVGKTEMAKALARTLFGEAERLIRFDMSEYRAEHADQRLLGAPPGYTGYDQGGQLTDAVKKQPFALLLFDEIEKAHPLILDKFLQILDDGRLTDGRGETAYFSECVMIFTSNLGILPMGVGETDLVTSKFSHTEMKRTVLRRIGMHFRLGLGRPELLNRFGDSFVVFDFIRPPHHATIVRGMVKLLITAMAERNQLALEIGEPVYEQLIEEAESKLDDGGRGIRNLIDSVLVNPLARAMADLQVKSPAVVWLDKLDPPDEDGQRPKMKIEWKQA